MTSETSPSVSRDGSSAGRMYSCTKCPSCRSLAENSVRNVLSSSMTRIITSFSVTVTPGSPKDRSTTWVVLRGLPHLVNVSKAVSQRQQPAPAAQIREADAETTAVGTKGTNQPPSPYCRLLWNRPAHVWTLLPPNDSARMYILRGVSVREDPGSSWAG